MVTGDRDGGSVIVGALALAVTAMLVIATATARTTGSAIGAAAMADRAEARTSAELALRTVLLDLESRAQRGALTGTAALDVEGLRVATAERLDWSARRSLGLTVTGAGPSGSLDVVVEVGVGTASATASAEVRPWRTSDFALVSEHAATDPALSGAPRIDCTWPPGHPSRSSGCVDTPLVIGAVDGPVHSNEPLQVAGGTTLHSVVTTTSVAPPDPATAAAAADAPFGVEARAPVHLGRSTHEMLAETVVTCRFRGPTLIRFLGTGIRVTSPRSVPRADEPADDDERIGCGDADRSLLGAPVAIALPPSAVIEVVRDADVDCSAHPLGIGAEEDSERGWWCNGGDAFVWGQYQGLHTVVAEDNVQIVWDLTRDGDAADHGLGLVAGDSIVLRRPVGRPIRRIAPYGRNTSFAGPDIPPFGTFPLDAPTETARTWEAPRIDAALAALRGSVTIQNPFRGERHSGTLLIRGSVAGRFTGLFAFEERSGSGTLLNTTGYPVELRYDRRFTRTPPPALPTTDGGRLRIVRLDVG